MDNLQHHLDVWRTREQYVPHTRCAEVLDKLRVPVGRITRYSAPFTRGHEVAAAFESVPCMAGDKIVQTAFGQLRDQVDYWWRILHKTCGVRVDSSDSLEPYASATEQCADMRTGRLVISYKLGNGHPLLHEEDYWRFRAVHDAFGHAGIGRGFDRHGEYQAWLVHTMMFNGYGCWAMSSEYRGVNSSLCFGRNEGTGKAVLLPAHVVLPEVDHPNYLTD